MELNLNFFLSPWTDPFKNLALEDQLLKNMSPHEKILLLYENKPCVVMGRFQNPWRELNLEALGHIKLVRRQSGGGTVFHDEGNLCFSFLHGTRDHHKDSNNQIVIKALKMFGIEAYSSNRSDLILKDKRKFSGSAFKQKKNSSFHHGTLLINSDLSQLNAILDSPLKKLEGKGILSNPSRVVNLKELNPEVNKKALADALKNSFEQFYGFKADPLNFEYQNSEYEVFLKSWDWMIGETPEFNVSEPSFDLVVKKGIIQMIKIKHVPQDIARRLEAKLLGTEVKKSELKSIVRGVNNDFSEPWLFELENQLGIYFY